MSSHEDFIEKVIIMPSVISPEVIEAFKQVDRADFLPDGCEADPYEDNIINLSDSSTMSQPSLIARMIEPLHIKSTDVVFELGTASGYSSAVKGRLAQEVHTVERDELLAERAKENLKKAGIDNVFVYTGDGLKGVPDGRSFDKGVLTAALKSHPIRLLEKLQPGGRLLAPLVPDIKNFPMASLTAFDKDESGEVSVSSFHECWFVPIVSEEPGGFHPDDLPGIYATQDKILRRAWAADMMHAVWGEHGISGADALFLAKKEIADGLEIDEEISDEFALDIIGIGAQALTPSKKVIKTIKDSKAASTAAA